MGLALPTFKPLVIFGPQCSGKSTLINHLRFQHPDLFEKVLPYTNRTEFLDDEALNTDYKRIDQIEFNDLLDNDELLFVEQIDEGVN